jgi:F-type H+-transporting ATPase subunit b
MSILKRPLVTGSVLLLLSLFLLPALALASEAGYVFGTIRRDVWDLILRVVNFAVLLGVLVYFVRKPLVGAIRNSIESVRALLKDAEDSRKASEAHMKESEEKLAGVDKEINDLLAAARKEGEAERERILSEASTALEKLKAEAALAIELELKKAQDVLRKEAADAAVSLAEEIIGRNVTPEDQARFVTEYLEKLEVKQ